MAGQGIFQILFLVFLFLLGAAVGSFLACQARRLRLREAGHRSGFKPGRRSVCLKCHYQLKWYDNIPIFSWLFLKGRCRKCNEKIGILEFLAEIGMGLSFLAYGASVLFSPAGVAFSGFGGLGWAGPSVLVLIRFILMLFLISGLGFLAIYDGAYGELPVKVLTFSIICAIIIAIVDQTSFFLVSSGTEITGADLILNRARQVRSVFGVNLAAFPLSLVNLAGAVGILGGVYLLLYIVSKGKWVGDGDWLLGLALGLALGDTWLALVTLFLANLLALVVSLPSLGNLPGLDESSGFDAGKHRGADSARQGDVAVPQDTSRLHGQYLKRKIYFGPFLVVAFVLVLTFSETLKSVVS